MNKPDFEALPRAFREDYVKYAALRLLPSAAVAAAAVYACLRLDFSGLRHPASGPIAVAVGAAAVCCVLFGLHRFLRPAWQGTVTEIDCGYKLVNTGNRAAAEKQMMVDLTVDRGGKKPHRIRLFREEGVTHGRTKINIFQREAPYKEGDMLLFLPGFRYPARMDVKEADETLDPKFVCPFCGCIGPLSKESCPSCGRAVLK